MSLKNSIREFGFPLMPKVDISEIGNIGAIANEVPALTLENNIWAAGENYASGKILYCQQLGGWIRSLAAITNAQLADFDNSVHKWRLMGSVGSETAAVKEMFGYLFMDARTIGATGSGATLAHDKYTELRDFLWGITRVGLSALTVSSVTNNGGGKVRLTFSGSPDLSKVQIQNANFPSAEAVAAGLGVTLPADSARVNFGSGAANYQIIGVNDGSDYIDIELAFASQSVTDTVGVYPHRVPGSEVQARLPESRNLFDRSGRDGFQSDATMRHKHALNVRNEDANSELNLALSLARRTSSSANLGHAGGGGPNENLVINSLYSDPSAGTVRDDIETRSSNRGVIKQIKW